MPLIKCIPQSCTFQKRDVLNEKSVSYSFQLFLITLLNEVARQVANHMYLWVSSCFKFEGFSRGLR